MKLNHHLNSITPKYVAGDMIIHSYFVENTDNKTCMTGKSYGLARNKMLAKRNKFLLLPYINLISVKYLIKYLIYKKYKVLYKFNFFWNITVSRMHVVMMIFNVTYEINATSSYRFVVTTLSYVVIYFPDSKNLGNLRRCATVRTTY